MSPALPLDAAVDLAVDDDAAADAGADLDEEEVVDRAGEPGVQLAERHDVDVVVDEDRAAEVLARALAGPGTGPSPA